MANYSPTPLESLPPDAFSDPAVLAAALSSNAEFFDVEGIPVSENEPLAGALYCAAWDVLPPRKFSFESARRNGSPIPADEFARMVAAVQASAPKITQ